MTPILIADDEHDILLALELLLSEEGYQVITASNGKDALARLAEIRPALVMVDLMMPFLSGVEVIRVMKADPEYKSIPVILMSAAIPHVKQDDSNWNLFLKKPFDIDPVLKAIESLLSK